MSRDELIWDHTGEDLDDPLIGSYEGEEAILRSRYEIYSTAQYAGDVITSLHNSHVSDGSFLQLLRFN